MLSEKLNFILAFCAILISGASFYATYLQANSAERQVKAMTLPLIQFSHGNYDEENDIKLIDFTLKNAGVGPAIIKRVEFELNGIRYKSPKEYFQACCSTELALYAARRENNKESSPKDEFGGWVSQPLIDIILPGQSDYDFQRITHGASNLEFWEKLNDARWQTNLNICYCSMLDDCFESERNGVVIEVPSCS